MADGGQGGRTLKRLYSISHILITLLGVGEEIIR